MEQECTYLMNGRYTYVPVYLGTYSTDNPAVVPAFMFGMVLNCVEVLDVRRPNPSGSS